MRADRSRNRSAYSVFVLSFCRLMLASRLPVGCDPINQSGSVFQGLSAQQKAD
jgi:hypothetical protein